MKVSSKPKRNILGALLVACGVAYVVLSVTTLHEHPNTYLALALVGLGAWLLDRPDVAAFAKQVKGLRPGGGS